MSDRKSCRVETPHFPHKWVEEWGYAGHGGFREENLCPGVEEPVTRQHQQHSSRKTPKGRAEAAIRHALKTSYPLEELHPGTARVAVETLLELGWTPPPVEYHWGVRGMNFTSPFRVVLVSNESAARSAAKRYHGEAVRRRPAGDWESIDFSEDKK